MVPHSVLRTGPHLSSFGQVLRADYSYEEDGSHKFATTSIASLLQLVSMLASLSDKSLTDSTGSATIATGGRSTQSTNGHGPKTGDWDYTNGAASHPFLRPPCLGPSAPPVHRKRAFLLAPLRASSGCESAPARLQLGPCPARASSKFAKRRHDSCRLLMRNSPFRKICTR